jgi:ABC-type amino acid transport substrate-binding protein
MNKKQRIKNKFFAFFHCSLFIVICYLFLMFVISCKKPNETVLSQGLVSPFASFRDIPGITVEEIAAIELLQKEHKTFSYGMSLTTEAFIRENSESGYSGAETGGYAALFCEWLTGLFGIRFRPELYTWNDIIEKLNSGEIDFAGNMTPTEERRKTYYMTDPIAERQYKMMLLGGRPSLNRIAAERPIRYAFLEGAVTANDVALVSMPGTYEAVFVGNFADAYKTLESGEADAFIGESVAEASFDVYGDVYSEDFFPLIFGLVSMTTAKEELQPVISVITKAQRNGAMPYLNKLYNQGYEDYKKNKFFRQLIEEERLYIQNHPVIHFAAETGNYPVCFYNASEKQWQGIAIEVLHEVEQLSSLHFVHDNDKNASFTDQLKMLEDGKVAMITELI